MIHVIHGMSLKEHSIFLIYENQSIFNMRLENLNVP